MAMLAAGHCWRGCGGALVSVFRGVFAGGGGGAGRWAIILKMSQNVIKMIVGRQIYSYSFLISHLSSVFSPLHVKHFDKDEKISFRIDESITPFFNTIHRLVC